MGVRRKHMRIKFAVFFLLLLAASPAYSQGFRFDSQVSQGLLTTQIIGATNVLTIPSSSAIAFCTYPANGVPCTNKATTYTSITLATPCSTSTQITLVGSTTCVASPDAQGNWGVYVPAGNYAYTISVGGANSGPYTLTLGTTAGTATKATNLVGPGAVTGNYTHGGTEAFTQINGPRVYASQFASLQAAHDSLPSTGGTVLVECGTYTGNSSSGVLNVSKSHVWIHGEGRCAILRNSQLGTPGSPIPILQVTGTTTDVLIDNLQIQGQAVDQTTDQACVFIGGSTARVTVENNLLTGTTGSSGCNRIIHVLSGAQGFLIQGNEWNQAQCGNSVANCTAASLGYGVIVVNAGPGLIANNRSIFTATNGRHHIYLSQGTTHVRVVNNYAFGGTSSCFPIFSTDAQSAAQYNEITDNTCVGSVAITGGMVEIANNASNNKIIGNMLIGGPGTANNGIVVWDGGSANTHLPNENVVEHNTVKSAGLHGINLTGVSFTRLKGNQVINPGTSGAFNCIQVAGDNPNHSDNNEITDNACSGTLPAWSLLIQGVAPIPANIIIQGNVFPAGSSGAISDSSTSAFYGVNIVSGITRNNITSTLKKGTGSGNYTTASTTYVVADSTNLCGTFTIPTGWKLSISTSGALGTATAAALANYALTDNAACSTANSGILVEGTVTTTAAAALQPFALNWVITGDGASHNIALQYKTSNAADSATLLNASATQIPTLVFQLEPSK
jgi:hypothetical protein